jgi:predicted ribonuclease YlaK
MAPFGYVDLNKHVKAGLILQKNKSELTAINIKHSSNTSVLSQIELDDDSNLVINSTLRFYNYKGLQIAQTTKSLNLIIRYVASRQKRQEYNWQQIDICAFRSSLPTGRQASSLPTAGRRLLSQ